MRTKGDSLLGIVGWLSIGLVLALFALLSLFGGLILVGLMVVGGVSLFGVLVLGDLFGKQPVYVTSFKEEEAPAIPLKEAIPVAPPAKVLAGRVYVRAIGTGGLCPQGYQIKAGDTWVLNGKPQGTARLCLGAYQGLSEYAEHARHGENGGKALNCADGHECMRVEAVLLRLDKNMAAAWAG